MIREWQFLSSDINFATPNRASVFIAAICACCSHFTRTSAWWWIRRPQGGYVVSSDSAYPLQMDIIRMTSDCDKKRDYVRNCNSVGCFLYFGYLKNISTFVLSPTASKIEAQSRQKNGVVQAKHPFKRKKNEIYKIIKKKRENK